MNTFNQDSAHHGFTLIELLIVTLLGSVIVLSTYQILLTNERAYTVQGAEVQGQQTLRAGLDVLFGELREISASDGDLVYMGGDTISIRTPRAFGVVCATSYGGLFGLPLFWVRPVGKWLSTGDSVVILADNDSTIYTDDTWQVGVITAIDTTQTCGGAGAQVVQVTGLSASDTVRMGAPIRSFLHSTYALASSGGEGYLVRQQSGGAWQLLVGPLAPGGRNGLRFEYFDENATTTTTPADVARIVVTLRTISAVVDQQGDRVQDSVSAGIYIRN